MVLQALTRFKFIKERNKLEKSNKRYNPMYRSSSYKFVERCKLKNTNRALWYKGVNIGDAYKQEWKRAVRKKGDVKLHLGATRGRKKEDENKNITTVMFVPSSPGSELLNILEKRENEALARKEFSWGVKLVEKSGTPLNMLFIKKFPLLSGCPINTSPACGTEKLNCSVCENDALKCSPKNVVYLSECMDCKQNVSEDCDRFLYVGESSRPLRMRTQEHWNN